MRKNSFKTQSFYSYRQAAALVRKLKIKKWSEYHIAREVNPRLPACPNVFYGHDWKNNGGSDGFFLLKPKYESLNKIKRVTKELGIESWSSYWERYKEDPRLPRHPNKQFPIEWIENGGASWFFDKDEKTYKTWEEAADATKKLNINGIAEYTRRYKEDPRLPSNLAFAYPKEWAKGKSYAFFGKEKKRFYKNFEAARKAVKRLKITNYEDYADKRHLDKRLPSSPTSYYKSEWESCGGGKIFFDRPDSDIYPTWEEASAAAKKLGVKSAKEYHKKYTLDPRLRNRPEAYYPEVWTKNGGIKGFLGIVGLYKSLEEVISAVNRLEIQSTKEYRERHHEDKRLPAYPEIVFSTDGKINQNFKLIFKKPKRVFYSTIHEARAAVARLNIKNFTDYKEKRDQDPLLPFDVYKTYKNDWSKNGGHKWFFEKEPKPFLPLTEAKVIVQGLGIDSLEEYKRRYIESEVLPKSIVHYYGVQWKESGGAKSFFAKKPKVYKTFEEASEAAFKLGLYNSFNYRKRHMEDPLLPKFPENTYQKEWIAKGGADAFFVSKEKLVYKSYDDASTAVKILKINDFYEYKKRYKEDPCLPPNPTIKYKSEWKLKGGAPCFFGRSLMPLYPTWEEASAAAQHLGITTSQDYKKRCKEDPRLPSNPAEYYKEVWPKKGGMKKFLKPLLLKNINDLKQAVRVLEIKSSQSYRENYKKYGLPAHPERTFKEEWVNWYDLCDMPLPYDYEKFCSIVRENNLKTSNEYTKFAIKSKDPKLPRAPHDYYREQWINWYVLFEKEEPFKVKNIRDPYLQWGSAIKNFMRTAKGGISKESYLCRFVRFYIQKNNMATSPCGFLLDKTVDLKSYRIFLDSFESDATKKKVDFAVTEFLDSVILTELTEEDDETGELIVVPDAKNRLKSIVLDLPKLSKGFNETVKPALAFQYVSAMKNWIIPSNATDFSDLTHIQIYDADWYDIPFDQIDFDDKNCIIKFENESYKIWNPIFWILTYALVSVPARGRQIFYNDSGEADCFIPEFSDGRITFVKNDSPMAGLTDNQGFIKQYPNNQFGMRFTTNKTSIAGGAYDVPWMPEQLAYWIIKLRKWQEKYNPIIGPASWMECERTNLNELQRKAKGKNCFLFREFGSNVPGNFSGRLAVRVAASLYNTQPPGLSFAHVDGARNILTNYKSQYTPHSFRVSLITAYTLEFGLPIEIVMKIVGHSSILMAIYYVKINSEDLREKISEAEKISLKKNTRAAQKIIEQNRIDSIKHELVGNSADALMLLNNKIPAGNFLFRDYGLCPYAGTRCDDGGDIIGKTSIRGSAPSGYLGVQNCLRCRHFVTGPAFIGGLYSLINEISLQANIQADQHNSLAARKSQIEIEITKQDEQEYAATKKNSSFDESDRLVLQAKVRKLDAELESAAKKLDMYLTDIQYAYKLLKEIEALINKENSHVDSGLQLIASDQREIYLSADETSFFHQLCEVCENAEIYESASASLAVSPRSQLLDKMLSHNGIQPKFFGMNQEQQLLIGNQLMRLFMGKVKIWSKMDMLIDGKIKLEDLYDSEKISITEVAQVFQQRLVLEASPNEH